MTRNAITTIPFHGANILVKPGDTPEATMVAMKPVVEGMGLEWSGQRQKMERHPVLSVCTVVTPLQMPGDDQERDHTFLPLNRLHFWLATIHPDRIKDEAIRDRVIDNLLQQAPKCVCGIFSRRSANVRTRVASL